MLKRIFFLSASAAAVLLAACVGDSVTVDNTPGKDASTTPDATSDGSSAADASDSAAVDASAPSDSSMGPDSSKPTTTCVDQTLAAGAFNHLCSVNPIAVNPGGTFAVGTYASSLDQGQPYCPIPYIIGSAVVYQENNATFFRFWVLRKTTPQDPGTPVRGTYWIKTNGNGQLEVEEMCDLQNKGKIKTGTLSVSGADYTMTWSNGQETWTKQ